MLVSSGWEALMRWHMFGGGGLRLKCLNALELQAAYLTLQALGAPHTNVQMQLMLDKMGGYLLCGL